MGQAHGDSSSSLRVARLAVDRGFLTPRQLQEAVDLHDREGLGLREVLLGKHLLTGAQFLRLEADAQSAPAFPPFGRFVPSRELGRGSSAVVFDALDTAAGRRVALKVFHPGPAADVARFLREGALAAKLPTHPGLVGVLEAGDVEGVPYIAMELVDGPHLDAWLRQGSVGFPAYVEVLRDAARAVDHAHRYGIIHRDLKPENILVEEGRRARVTDFGLARTVDGPTLSAAGTAVGTPAYMSPEQIRGREIDRRSDVWALGVMLYEGLTGRRPFDGATAFEAMTRAVHEDPMPPSKASRLQMNPGHFAVVERIALKALAKTPADRYATAADFADDLQRWLKGERFEIRLPSPASGPRRPKRWLAPATAALIGALGASAFLLWPRAEPARPALPAPAVARGAVLEYCAGLNFNSLGKREVDARPRFNDPADEVWPEGPEYYVSLRWSGRLRVPKTATYVFHVRAPEGALLRIARADVVSNAAPNTSTDRSGQLRLERGQHEFLFEVFHSGAPSEVAVTWSPEGAPAVPLGPGDLVHDPASFAPVTPAAVNGPVVIPGVQEGEALEVVDASGRETAIKAYAPFRHFWKGRWSGASHLWWGVGARRGDSFTVRFRSGAAGRRTLLLALTRSMDHGTFRVSVNGKPVLEALDLYAADLTTGEIEVPGVELRAGANELSFKAVDANPAAREWGPGAGMHKLGIDYLLVR